MVVGCQGENCLPYCIGSESLEVSLKATSRSKKVYLLSLPPEWDQPGLLKKT